MKGMQRRFCCKVFSGKQRRKNAVGFATEVVDSLLWVERHPGTVTGLPPKERLQKRIHLSLQLLFCFPAGTVNFLLLRHENMDRLPSFAVNLDEDPTDIFGAVCALLVGSALLKNCNNYLLDNKPSYGHVSNGKNTVTFELILLQTQRRSNWLDEIWC